MMLRGTYFPKHAENRMQGEGDVQKSRNAFLANRPRNLEFLLRKRYSWMNQYIQKTDRVVEFGAGSGFGKLFISHDKYVLTDTEKRPWIDMSADAMDPPFEDGAIDVIICSHMIHHLSSPLRFFRVANRKLASGGRILIQDLNTCLLLRCILRLMRHEGWSYDVDVFDETIVANDPNDPWSANCAIPELLFRDSARFLDKIPGYRIDRNELNECFIFPLSGGVVAKAKTVQLPFAALRAVDAVDSFFVKHLPSLFAMGRSVVLVKV